MDLVASYKEKLAQFRIKELKDILTPLGLSKQGKKQDLVDRILAIIADDRVSGMWAKKNAVRKEEVVKLVDDHYRKLQAPGATDLASKGLSVSNVGINTTLKEEVVDTLQKDKVRCLCGNTSKADSMIKCEDKKCNVWQHISCVIIPEKPMESLLPIPPPTFYCELCRLTRADPYWVSVGHPVYPVKLTIASAPTEGANPVQSVEKAFQLTKLEREMLAKPEFELQAWCMLLNDKVSFRMQWPQYADLQVNGMPVRAINRPGSQLLGANGRDDGPIITPCARDGSNKISLAGCDARVFCLGVRIARRRTFQQILNLIPKESDGERFEDAVARVCRCVGGGPAAENADSDSDLEVVSDYIPVNLRCPMSGSRMKIAGRFKPCAHMGCFDLEVFVQMNQRSRKWQCPICLKNYALENVIIDPYFTRITTKKQFNNLIQVSKAMAILSLRVFMIMVICCCATFAESMTMKYKDPTQPLRLRINDLMLRMTLEEKIGQMTQIDGDVATPDIMKNYLIGSLLSGEGINMVNEFQKGSLSTRLGIPVMYGNDDVNGNSNAFEATIFPHNVALEEIRDPELKKVGAPYYDAILIICCGRTL